MLEQPAEPFLTENRADAFRSLRIRRCERLVARPLLGQVAVVALGILRDQVPQAAFPEDLVLNSQVLNLADQFMAGQAGQHEDQGKARHKTCLVAFDERCSCHSIGFCG